MTDLRFKADAIHPSSPEGVEGLLLRSSRWSTLSIVLVVVLLLASVLIPARQSWRIMNLLRETTDAIEPARLHASRLESGLIAESAALDGYVLTEDRTQLVRYRRAVADNDRRLAAVEEIAARLGDEAIDRVAAVRSRMDQWRDISRESVDGRVPRDRIAEELQAHQESYEAAVEEVTRLTLYLGAEGTARREVIGGSERMGLLVNASLVFVALAAVLAVGALSHRERQLSQILERVTKSRSRLMRGFSHDLKNPLGAADGYAALLADGVFGPLAAPQVDGIRRIRACIHSALGLIDDLHELARAETGNIVLSPERIDLTELVRGSAEEYSASAKARGLLLSVDVEPDPLTVVADRARLQQIVGNLLSNAIKYTDEGSVVLRARRETLESAADSNAWGRIDVRDTGPGIASEKLGLIFEEFIRVGNDEKSGAGLGLAISQKLAQAMGGHISVQSELGFGSTFTVRLPRSAGPDPLNPQK